MTDQDAHLAVRQSLFDDAEYVAVELARGDAVPADVLAKAKPYIDPLMQAVLAARAAPPPGNTEYCALQSAMIDMMTAIAPVTVGSLKDTDIPVSPKHSLFIVRWLADLFGYSVEDDTSPAERFGDGIMVVTVLFLLSALGSTLLIQLKTTLDPVLAALQTILYGGLGACVFLLRALHKHIHERTFDRRFRPEYYNRIVLGVVSGGVITVLVPADDVSNLVAKVGAAALAFLVGYNTDLLFSLIERVSNALFPKVPDAPTAAAAAMPANPPADAKS